MVTKLHRPRNLDEALRILETEEGSLPLAGGTFLLTNQFRDRAMTLVSVADALPSAVERNGDAIVLGANATFQAVLDSGVAPKALRAACLGMANRNVRNRATVAGNAAAAKSCGSLPPLFLATGAAFELAYGGVMEADGYFREPSGLIARIRIPFEPGKRHGYARWSRTACDVSVLTCAASYTLEGGLAREVRVACGGLSARPRRFPEIERLLEGSALPSRDELEAAIAPLLDPIDDARGSAAFKRLRASVLIADAILNAEVRA